MSKPVRRFTWRAGQSHRPGLQYMVGTGRMLAFESLAERRLLIALDFLGGLIGVLAQPFQVRAKVSAQGVAGGLRTWALKIERYTM